VRCAWRRCAAAQQERRFARLVNPSRPRRNGARRQGVGEDGGGRPEHAAIEECLARYHALGTAGAGSAICLIVTNSIPSLDESHFLLYSSA